MFQSPQGLGKQIKSVCVCQARQILVLGMWVVLKCMASPRRPLVMSHFRMKAKKPPPAVLILPFKSWTLRLPIRARRLRSSSSVCEGGGSIFCVPPSSCPLLGLCPIPGSFLQRGLFKRPSRCFVRLWTVSAWESTFCCTAICVRKQMWMSSDFYLILN